MHLYFITDVISHRWPSDDSLSRSRRCIDGRT